MNFHDTGRSAAKHAQRGSEEHAPYDISHHHAKHSLPHRRPISDRRLYPELTSLLFDDGELIEQHRNACAGVRQCTSHVGA